MTIAKLYEILEKSAPRALSAEWDNDGMACCADTQKEVKRVLVALDATEAAVNYATENKFDLLLTHHPLLFRGVKELTPGKCVPRKLLKLALGGVAAISLHTRLDAAEGGLAVMEAGHFYTERPVLVHLAALVKAADPTVEVQILDTPTIQTITK